MDVNDIVVVGMALVGLLLIVIAVRSSGRQGERRKGDDGSVGVTASDGGQCGTGSSGDCGGGDGGGGD